ncbi:hypothetical protein [Streptomyces sp. NPDC090798]|uniref:hypothetical protein n=1 Tax=Streptomyces sp. NPDC090798 TaxID=3365968 RepID=UPI003805EEFC
MYQTKTLCRSRGDKADVYGKWSASGWARATGTTSKAVRIANPRPSGVEVYGITVGAEEPVQPTGFHERVRRIRRTWRTWRSRTTTNDGA